MWPERWPEAVSANISDNVILTMDMMALFHKGARRATLSFMHWTRPCMHTFTKSIAGAPNSLLFVSSFDAYCNACQSLATASQAYVAGIHGPEQSVAVHTNPLMPVQVYACSPHAAK